jgi:hypothetical protein
MPRPNPRIAEELRRARAELARLKADKLRLFPPNPHPFTQPDSFPRDATPAQIARRNALIARIEDLEQRIGELEDQLYMR